MFQVILINLCSFILTLIVFDTISYILKNMKKEFTTKEAQSLGEKIGIDFTEYDLEEFRMGLGVELEHGAGDPETNVTNNDEIMTAKIAWAHLKEIPDYYTRLLKMEKEAGS